MGMIQDVFGAPSYSGGNSADSFLEKKESVFDSSSEKSMSSVDSFLVVGDLSRKKNCHIKKKKKNCDKIAVIGQELKKSRLDFELHKP